MQQNFLKPNLIPKLNSFFVADIFIIKNCPTFHTTIGQSRIELSVLVKIIMVVHLDRFLSMSTFLAKNIQNYEPLSPVDYQIQFCIVNNVYNCIYVIFIKLVTHIYKLGKLYIQVN